MKSQIAESPMNSIRAILVDDEPLMRGHLRERLSAHPEVDLVGEASGVDSAVELLGMTMPDVIFLDVQMSPDNGFDLLPRLEGIVPCPLVIFVTAFDKYALKAFETHALDYLTKPVHPKRLANAISRLHQSLADRKIIARMMDHSGASNSISVRPSSDSLDVTDLIPLQDGAYIRMVKVCEISAAEVQGDYTRIFAAGGRAVMIKSTLSLWESRLPSSLFYKISRRLIVNRKQVKQIVILNRENTQVFLNGIDEPLLLSRIEVRRLKHIL